MMARTRLHVTFLMNLNPPPKVISTGKVRVKSFQLSMKPSNLATLNLDLVAHLIAQMNCNNTQDG